MPPRRLMLIRHGEKEPDSGPPPYGVNPDGALDPHSLSPRGWQRAGALAPFFTLAWARGIKPPDAVFASKVGTTVLMADGFDISQSLRPQQTVTPLVELLRPKHGLQTPFAVGEESALSKTLAGEEGVVLVAWEHHHIPIIAAAFTNAAPSSWSGDCFDEVWVLARKKDGSYAFKIVPQALLNGDSSS